MARFARLLASPVLEVAGQMALDEALLDAALPFPCLRIYRWPVGAPSATFGYAQRFAEVRAVLESPFRERCTRRLTGGGIVLHDDDLTFSIVHPLGDAPWNPAETYRTFHLALAGALRQAGVEAVPVPAAAPDAADRSRPSVEGASQCFREPVAFDLLDAAGRKILGGALRHRRGHALYQGALRLPGARGGRQGALSVAIQGAFATIFQADALLPMAAPVPSEGACARYASRQWIQMR